MLRRRTVRRALTVACALVLGACSFELADVATDAGVARVDGGKSDSGSASDASSGADGATGGDAARDAGPDAPRVARVSSGIVALYDFEEDAGATVFDRSGVAPALDLTIADNNAFTRNGGSFTLTKSARLRSSAAASKIANACVGSGEITTEAWAQSSALPQGQQGNSARIVELGVDNAAFEFILGVIATEYRFNVVTSNPSVVDTSGNVPTTTLQHIVATRQANGTQTLYVNGTARSTVQGSTGTLGWSNNHPLVIGNSDVGTTPWLGTLQLVAIYARALTAAEVAQNYAAGP